MASDTTEGNATHDRQPDSPAQHAQGWGSRVEDDVLFGCGCGCLVGVVAVGVLGRLGWESDSQLLPYLWPVFLAVIIGIHGLLVRRFAEFPLAAADDARVRRRWLRAISVVGLCVGLPLLAVEFDVLDLSSNTLLPAAAWVFLFLQSLIGQLVLIRARVDASVRRHAGAVGRDQALLADAIAIYTACAIVYLVFVRRFASS